VRTRKWRKALPRKTAPSGVTSYQKSIAAKVGNFPGGKDQGRAVTSPIGEMSRVTEGHCLGNDKR